MSPVPTLPGDLKPWERHAANLGHLGLYLLMFAASLSGWCLAGTGRRPFQQDIFGLTVPLITTNRATHEVWENVHMAFSYLLAALVVVHIIGALRHHFIKGNTVLARMVGLKTTG